MSRNMICLLVLALVAPVQAVYDTVGVYDPDDAPHHNQVDQSGTYASHTGHAGPENVVTLEAFGALIGPAFEADAGGVVDGEHGSLDGQDMIAKFGAGQRKSVTFTNTSGILNSGSSVKNNRRPISGSRRWAKSETGDFVFDVGHVSDGAPGESITHFAGSVLHRDNRDINPVVTATFSGGGTVTSVAEMAMAGPINSKDTFFGFVAPPGQSIVNINFDLGGYTNLDDVGFITSAFVVVLEHASNPSPVPGTVDLPRDTVLDWTAGAYAETHDVYFGTSFEDVNNASRAHPMGVLASQGQDTTPYDPTALLEFGQTYYWRVDAVNAAPDSTIFRGQVWSFTAEPLAYPIENVTATASSSNPDARPENTINGSGLDIDNLHSTDDEAMWLTGTGEPGPAWIQYEFDRVYKLHEMWVWNYNVVFEQVLGYGLKDVTVEFSDNGTDWTVLDEVEFAQGSSAEGYAHNTVVDLGGATAQYVRLTARDNWGALAQYGLSEVRFFSTPAHPREPQPADGQMNVNPNAVLTWRAGREAAAHEVYLGTDPNALAMAGSVSQPAFVTGDFQFGNSYYWAVTEVNEAATPPAWEGDLWTFATQEYAMIEDFESYTDEEGSSIYETWIDGWTNETSSTVGYLEAPFAEQSVVHGGVQSMPLQYNNADAPGYSETQRTFAGIQDWTINGADTLALHFRGHPAAFVERAGGTIVVSGAGADIWNSTDRFRYAHQQLRGDGEIVARVDSVLDTHAWAKVGVMMRESSDPGAPFAAVYITPGNGCSFQTRTSRDVAAVSDSAVATAEQTAITAPYWVKLERRGDQFSGFYSADGEVWTAMAWTPPAIAMVDLIDIGLAVTSHNADYPTVAEFSGVEATGEITGPWQVEAIGVEQPSNDPDQFYVAVEDSAGRVAVVVHPDDAAVQAAGWQEWLIPYAELDPISLSSIKALYIGVGDRDNPTPAGSGMLYIDDIQFGHPAATE